MALADRETVLADSPESSSSISGVSTLGNQVAVSVIGDRYEVLGMLGSGAMGNVYKVRDRELDEVVALKMVRDELALSADALDRFRREVKLARRITHPSVARVFDIGEVTGPGEQKGRYLTMEYIEGESLRTLVSRELELTGYVPMPTTVEIVSAVCGGLSAAHEAGVVHRDLKPDNILVERPTAPSRPGRVVITDFGIARAIAGNTAKLTSSLIGTPAYMAPEQLDPSQPVDGRADIYALGVMLFEMLTGDVPWQGESIIAVATARLLKDPPDPRSRKADLPEGIAQLVLKCMAKEPSGRFATAAELATKLSQLTLPNALMIPLKRPSVPPVKLPQSPQVAEKRVAVLPFRFSGPADQEYIADGLTEDLIDLLSMSKDLRVQSRGRVMAMKGSTDPREVGRELGVDVVVDGSLRQAGDLVRISARLISVNDGMQIWAQRFDRPLAELLAISDDTARSVADALAATIRPAKRKATDDPQALDLYLRARAAYHSYFGGGADLSIGLFEKALVRAPDDVRILSGYAMARARAWNSEMRNGEAALAAALKAVDLAPELHESHLALATVKFHTGHEVEAMLSIRRALRISPNNGELFDLLGRMLCETMRLDHARRYLEAAIAAEPDCVLSRLALTRTCWFTGDFAEAERHIQQMTPTVKPQVEARTVLWSGDVERARRGLAQLQEGPLHPMLKGMYETVTTGAVPTGVLQAVGKTSGSARTRCFFAQLCAEAGGALKDKELTLSSIEAALADGLFDLAWMNLCPTLGFIQAEPRFLVAKSVVTQRSDALLEAYSVDLPPG